MAVSNTDVLIHLWEPYIFNHIVRPNGPLHNYHGQLYSETYYDKDKYPVVLTFNFATRQMPKWVSISSKKAGYNGAFYPQYGFSAFDHLVIPTDKLIVWMRFGLYLANQPALELDDLSHDRFHMYRQMLNSIKPFLRKRDSDFGKHFDLLW